MEDIEFITGKIERRFGPLGYAFITAEGKRYFVYRGDMNNPNKRLPPIDTLVRFRPSPPLKGEEHDRARNVEVL